MMEIFDENEWRKGFRFYDIKAKAWLNITNFRKINETPDEIPCEVQSMASIKPSEGIASKKVVLTVPEGAMFNFNGRKSLAIDWPEPTNGPSMCLTLSGVRIVGIIGSKCFVEGSPYSFKTRRKSPQRLSLVTTGR